MNCGSFKASDLEIVWEVLIQSFINQWWGNNTMRSLRSSGLLFHMFSELWPFHCFPSYMVEWSGSAPMHHRDIFSFGIATLSFFNNKNNNSNNTKNAIIMINYICISFERNLNWTSFISCVKIYSFLFREVNIQGRSIACAW